MILIIKDGLVQTTYNITIDYNLYDLNPNSEIIYIPDDYKLEYPTTIYVDENEKEHEIRIGLAPDPRPNMTLDLLKQCCNIQINNEAEYNRLKFLTTGSGQSMEYSKTSDDAIKANTAEDPLEPTDYPWLNAELQACLGIGLTITLRDIVDIVMQQINSWTLMGAFIKGKRRSTMMKVTYAPSVEYI